MIKNLEEATSAIKDKWGRDIVGYSIDGNSIDMEFRSRSGRSTWHGYIDFDDEGNFSTTNFMNAVTPSIIAREIKELLIIE